eukprot:626702-Amphidinium_carterae.1
MLLEVVCSALTKAVDMQCALDMQDPCMQCDTTNSSGQTHTQSNIHGLVAGLDRIRNMQLSLKEATESPTDMNNFLWCAILSYPELGLQKSYQDREGIGVHELVLQWHTACTSI